MSGGRPIGGGPGVTALEFADLIASLLREALDDDAVDEARPGGPLFAVVRVRGGSGRFAVVVEKSPRNHSRSAGKARP